MLLIEPSLALGPKLSWLGLNQIFFKLLWSNIYIERGGSTCLILVNFITMHRQGRDDNCNEQKKKKKYLLVRLLLTGSADSFNHKILTPVIIFPQGLPSFQATFQNSIILPKCIKLIIKTCNNQRWIKCKINKIKLEYLLIFKAKYQN